MSSLGLGRRASTTFIWKVFPEEVEEAVKKHAAVFDCLVVGVPDERFGERIIAVTSAKENQQFDDAEVIEFTKAHLAGYKVPKQVLTVDLVRRAPNGKADYKWAKKAALDALGGD